MKVEEMLSYLLWEIHDFPAPPVSVEIDQERYRVIHGWQRNGAPKPKWKHLAEHKRSQIETVLEHAEYWKWERSYVNPNMQDGRTWSIKVRGGTTGKRRKNCYGVNEFPSQWDRVYAIVMALGGADFAVE